MDDFRLKVFITAARTLSFTRTAEQLFISQPAVSKHVGELESRYKTQLFVRRGSRLELTPAGETLLTCAERLAGYNELESAPVEKKSKRNTKTVDLKAYVPALELQKEGEWVRFDICLPAAQELNLNPALLVGFLEERFGLPAASAAILRTRFLTAGKELFR